MRAIRFLALVACLSQVGAEPVDPNVTAGETAAKADIAAGTLKHELPLPEAFVLSWIPGSEKGNFMEYFTAVMADRYHVEIVERLLIPGPDDERLHAVGYDRIADPVIDAKFGADTVGKAWTAAYELSKDDRQKYLDARKNPATRPAGATTQP